MSSISRRLTLPLVLLALVACSARTAAPPPSSATSAAPTAVAKPTPKAAPTPVLPSAVLWQRTAAEYRAIHLQVFREAGEALERLAAGRAPGTWAVSVDADETIIDNSLYAYERARAADAYALPSWADWVKRREAAAVPGAIAFLQKVQNLGGRVAVVTNRGEDQCEDTRANLRTRSIPFDLVLCRAEGANGEKEGRWQAIASGTAVPGLRPLEILLWVGDNVGDFPGLDQSARDADESAFALFGERYFVLPNPVYGSWEKNTPR